MRVCANSQITRIAWSTSALNSTASDLPNANGRAGRMIHEDAGRVRGYSLLHLFHRLALFLARSVFANAEAGKNIKAGFVTDAALLCAKHR
jgi:hypothetical protein